MSPKYDGGLPDTRPRFAGAAGQVGIRADQRQGSSQVVRSVRGKLRDALHGGFDAIEALRSSVR